MLYRKHTTCTFIKTSLMFCVDNESKKLNFNIEVSLSFNVCLICVHAVPCIHHILLSSVTHCFSLFLLRSQRHQSEEAVVLQKGTAPKHERLSLGRVRETHSRNSHEQFVIPLVGPPRALHTPICQLR